MFDQRERAYVESARVARLATADDAGRPNAVPVCFTLVGGEETDDEPSVVTPIDEKPKRNAPDTLRRSRDVAANPHVALVVDHYTEDWDALGWVQIRGTAARLSPDHGNHATACEALRAKYDQYEDHAIEERPVIRIEAGSVLSWGRLVPESDAR
ncbi:MAG: TIGR03668 family PPOX class F420-dependent oxidoreductase [Haloarculaceae archaeon]